jgi:PAS domain S-box-containing protein
MFLLQSRRGRGWFARYVMAVTLFAVSLLLRLWLAPRVGERVPFSLFLPAIILASLFCGTGPSVLITSLSVLAADWFFIEPYHSLRTANMASTLGLALHAILGFTICGYGHINRGRRDQLEQSLREAERRRADYQTLFELSVVGQAEVDAVTGHFVRVNSKFCASVGYSPEDLSQMNFLELTHPDDRNDVKEAADKLIRGETSELQIQKRCVCKNRKIIDTLVSAAVICDTSGKRLVAAIRDISVEKRAERALVHAQQTLEGAFAERTTELQQELALFEQFCSSIAHDLRAPLRAMHNFATLLERRYARQLPEEGKLYAQRLTGASLRMDRLLMDLLEYGRISSEGFSLQTVNTEELVHKCVERMRQLPLARDGEILIQSPLPALRANAALLQEALENLLTNALKFIGPRGPPFICVRAEDRGATARLCIDDNGKGIPPEHHERIFGVFQRLDETGADSTGIGLAIVHTAVQRMKGAVGLNSIPGKGSTFWIELPKAVQS